jgi:hypothetical protein
MPTTQDDGKLRIPLLDGASNFGCFPDHRSGHKRDTKAESVSHFFEDAFLIVWRDGGINETNFESGTSNGVATANIPKGAVASELANDGKKKTILRDVDNGFSSLKENDRFSAERSCHRNDSNLSGVCCRAPKEIGWGVHVRAPRCSKRGGLGACARPSFSKLSPAGTAEGCPGLRRGPFSAVPAGLNHVFVMYPGLASWAKFSRPYGTESSRGSRTRSRLFPQPIQPCHESRFCALLIGRADGTAEKCALCALRVSSIGALCVEVCALSAIRVRFGAPKMRAD